MALEDRGKQHDKQVIDKYHDPNADYTMTTLDYVMRPYADGESGAITLTLPPVAEAKGRWYSIVCRNADAVNTVTIEDNNNDSECWLADIVLNGKCDKTLLYSDGLAWHVMGNAGWPGLSTTIPPGTTPAPTTVAPTTEAQGTTGAPTTVAATTLAPTTASPTTGAPTTIVTTLAPTTT